MNCGNLVSYEHRYHVHEQPSLRICSEIHYTCHSFCHPFMVLSDYSIYVTISSYVLQKKQKCLHMPIANYMGKRFFFHFNKKVVHLAAIIACTIDKWNFVIITINIFLSK